MNWQRGRSYGQDRSWSSSMKPPDQVRGQAVGDDRSRGPLELEDDCMSEPFQPAGTFSRI